jgi:hypothetical protein
MTLMSDQPPPPPAAREVSGLPFPLQDGERVLSLCRRHWIYLWPLVALYLFLALAPVVIAVIICFGGPGDGAWRFFWLLMALYVIYWAVRLVLVWYRYQHDIWVITNQRLIDSYRSHPFALRIATADLVNVQDMSIDRNGLLRTLLDFGDIVCQTAAEMPDFRMTGIPNPRQTQALVDRERDRERLRYRA